MQAFLGDNVTLALHDPRDGTDYAALNHGHFGVKLHRRDKGGEWTEIATPAYPPKPEGLDDRDGWGKPVKWTTQMIWALETGGADEPGTLWAGTMPGGLFRSTDRGDTWEMMENLWLMPDRNKWLGGGADIPGIHSICVDPRSSRDGAHRHFLRRRVGDGGWRQELAADRPTACASTMAPRRTTRTRRTRT